MFAFFLKAVENRRNVELTMMKHGDEASKEDAPVPVPVAGKRKRVEDQSST